MGDTQRIEHLMYVNQFSYTCRREHVPETIDLKRSKDQRSRQGKCPRCGVLYVSKIEGFGV